MYCLDISADRYVTNAGYNVYVNGIVHPDRVLEEHDFIYLIEGSWEIYMGDIGYCMFPGDVLILHAGEHHYGLQTCEPGTKTIYIHTSVCCGDSPEIAAGRNSYFIRPPFSELTSCKNNLRVRELFERIVSVSKSEKDLAPLKASALFKLLLHEIYESSTEFKTTGKDITDDMLSIIHENPQRFFTLKDFSGKYYLSPGTIVNKFKKKYDISPYKYQLEYKLRAVKDFIAVHPKTPLSDIAVNFGFYDEFHLSKVYKKYFGRSPRGN